MLQAYFDDSGSNPQENRFVLAGYILPAEKWASFSDAWAEQLKREPSIEFFKMSHAVRQSGAFAGLSQDQAQQKVRRFIEVLRTHNPDGVCSFLRWDEWEKFNSSLPVPHRDPYGMLFFRLIDNLVEYEKNLSIFPQNIQVDFDDQGNSGAWALEWFNRLYYGTGPWTFSDDHKRIIEATPRMLNSKQYLPIQAADMLAWAVRTHLEGLRNLEWQWAYENLQPTLWGGEGYCNDSWDAIRSIL